MSLGGVTLRETRVSSLHLVLSPDVMTAQTEVTGTTENASLVLNKHLLSL